VSLARARPTPPLSRFTPRERRIVKRLRTPGAVQDWLRELPYNWEIRGATLRTLRGVVRHGEANCLEAVLAAAAILEQHGYPPHVLDLESQDGLDHVLFLFRANGRWGTIGKSRDPGLHGRKPVFRSLRDLVWSYVDPYVDSTGRIVGYGTGDLGRLVRADWRLDERNVWSVERALIGMPHVPFATADERYARWHRRYLAFKAARPGGRPTYFPRRERWL
jgi:hypothetical protein